MRAYLIVMFLFLFFAFNPASASAAAAAPHKATVPDLCEMAQSAWGSDYSGLLCKEKPKPKHTFNVCEAWRAAIGDKTYSKGLCAPKVVVAKR